MSACSWKAKVPAPARRRQLIFAAWLQPTSRPWWGPASQLTVGCMMVLEADKTIGGGEPLRLPLR
jgi:hypothetical protein